jgi:hypothetical protein
MPLDDHFAPDHAVGALATRHLGAEVSVGRGADNPSEHSGRPLNGADARLITLGTEGLADPPPSARWYTLVEIESRHQRQFEPRLRVPSIADCQDREAALKEAGYRLGARPITTAEQAKNRLSESRQNRNWESEGVQSVRWSEREDLNLRPLVSQTRAGR